MLLFVSKHHHVDHRIYKIGDREPVKIQGVALDDYFKDGPKVDFIKLDVQGAEGLVLKGAPKTLKNCKAMLIEFCPEGLLATEIGIFGFKDMIQKAGFQTKQISNDNIYCFKPNK